LADTGPELVPIRWASFRAGEKTVKEVPSTFNARAETITDKPMFRSVFKRSRCIVPASGYRLDAPQHEAAGLTYRRGYGARPSPSQRTTAIGQRLGQPKSSRDHQS